VPRHQDRIVKHEIRVIFGDTDQMGVVYYGNYMRYFESSRAAYWRACGKTYQDLVDWDVAMPVVEAHCYYKSFARYEDILVVDVEVSELRAASLRFAYRITCGERLVCEGETRHAIVGANGRPKQLPEQLKNAIPHVGPPGSGPPTRAI
jgi:acyl-CoA thioester hydrolase